MQRGKKKSIESKLTLKGIPTARRHFYFYALLALVAVVSHRAIKSDAAVADNDVGPAGQPSHMSSMADNTRLAYR